MTTCVAVDRPSRRATLIYATGKMSNLSTTTETDLIEPIHPGEILMEDFIEGFGITQNKLAVSIEVPPRRINEIVTRLAGSPLTRRSVWRATPAPPRSSV